jgi:hypothetical protein
MSSSKADIRLAEARVAQTATARTISELEARRNAALLADDDATATAFDRELETLRRTERAHVDKVRLLEVEAEREAVARREREHTSLIERVEGKLRAREKAGREVADLVAKLETAYRKLISLSEEIAPAWPWSTVDRNTLMTTAAAIQVQLGHEFFRQSHKPFLGGSPGLRAEVSLPGSKCSRPVDWLGFPEREPALVDVLAACTGLASKIMRGESVESAEIPAAANSEQPDPIAPGRPVRTSDQDRLAKLLKRQAELAEDMTPAGEAAYQAVVSEIATLQ